MKLALLVLLVLIGVLLWKSRPTGDTRQTQAPPPQEPQPQDMVRCDLCSVHLPVADAVQGARGVYCSVEHRQHAES